MSEAAEKQETLNLREKIYEFIKGGPTELDVDEDGEDIEVEMDPKPKWAIVWIGVYEVDQLYGGPEEGGWWYDAWRPLTRHQWPIRVRMGDEGFYVLGREDREIIDEAERSMLAEFTFGTRNRTSCNPRKPSDYDWRLSWDSPEHYPRSRPRYC